MTAIEDIKKLREETGAGMMDCKRALEECSDDFEEAKVFLRKQGIINSQSRAHKPAEEGRIGVYQHMGNRICAMVEVRCETDFVSRGEDFQTFAHDVALHIAASNPRWVSRDQVPQETIDQEESIIAAGLGNKPPEIQKKIIAGKLDRFYKETCLLEQPFVKDPKISVQDLLDALKLSCKENVFIGSFCRLEVG